jgi:broad specificity phosphatase PhoE
MAGRGGPLRTNAGPKGTTAGMDAAVHNRQQSQTAARAGRIIVVRHGKPSLDREAGPRLDWRAYRDWWAQYEACSLADGQNAPEDLKKLAQNAIVFASMRPRAQQTAAMITGAQATYDPIFNEAPLPPPQWDSHRYLPKNWNKLARLAWLMGHHGGEETASATRQRASAAADRLIEAASGGRDVVLAAHGWFNRMLIRPLAKRGWKLVRNGGDSYWSYRVFEKQ